MELHIRGRASEQQGSLAESVSAETDERGGMPMGGLAAYVEIVLARHGPSSYRSPARMAGRELGTWSTRYDEAGLAADAEPATDLRGVARRARCIVASDLPRSLESAAALAPGVEIRTEPLLREAGLPASITTSLQLPTRAWRMIAIIGWWLNWFQSPGSTESVESVRQRAVLAASRLIELARQHETVLVVGHGMFNRFVGRQLVARGWRGPRMPTTGHWSSATYRWVACGDPDT